MIPADLCRVTKNTYPFCTNPLPGYNRNPFSLQNSDISQAATERVADLGSGDCSRKKTGGAMLSVPYCPPITMTPRTTQGITDNSHTKNPKSGVGLLQLVFLKLQVTIIACKLPVTYRQHNLDLHHLEVCHSTQCGRLSR